MPGKKSKTTRHLVMSAPPITQLDPPMRRPIGPPRLDHYLRLLHRLFEPLILLTILGRTQGTHTTFSKTEDTHKYWWREFVKTLAFLCDFEKGGDTTTAIYVQDRPDHFIFWVSTNCRSAARAVKFVQAALETVWQVLLKPLQDQDEGRNETIEAFTKLCIGCAKPRIKEEARLLRKHIGDCRGHLKRSQSDIHLGSWLGQFSELDPFRLCSLAHDHKRDDEMNELETRAASAPVFGNVRHYIGRLSAHISSPRNLVDNAQASEHVQKVFDNPFLVIASPDVPAVSAPPPDNLTRLELIMSRLMGTDLDHSRREEYLQALASLDRKFKGMSPDQLGLEDMVLEEYGKPTFKPRVHCEIQALEHAARSEGFEFAFKDRFIGVSKPACYCCWQYMRHHPAKPVEPPTHKNIWLNWSPPALPAGCGRNHPLFKEQQVLLNKVIEDLKANALEQILKQGNSLAWHPDSTTGISGETEVVLRMHRLHLNSVVPAPLAAYNSETAALRDGDSTPPVASPGSPESSSSGTSAQSSAVALRHSSTRPVVVEDSASDSEDEGGCELVA